MNKDFGEKAWAAQVSEASACVRLGSALGENVVFDVATLPDDAVLPVRKRLMTLLGRTEEQDIPDWVWVLSDRAEILRAQEQQK